MNVQVCHCGWTKRTTYHGLRVHQGMKGCTPKGMRIPQSEQPRFSHKPSYNEPQIKIEEPFEDHFKSSVFETPQRSRLTTEVEDSRARQVLDFSIGGQQTPNLSDMNVQVCHCGWTKYTTYHGLRVHQGKMGCTPKGMRIPQSEQSRFSHELSYNEPQIKIKEPFVDDLESSVFETPQRSRLTTEVEASRARRVLDFSIGGQQAKQEKLKAHLQQQIHIREHKMAEVRSSVTDCKASLDAEWLEVNNFFSDIIKVVEDARQKALQPLEERRRKVKRDTQDLLQKLQREIDVLKKAIDESNKNPDLEASLLTGLNDSNWKNVHVDTSLSFGTLRATTSTMMKQIHKELDKLSPIEFKRIPTFAVDVKLDPTTAHQRLEISDNGKKVKDSGNMSTDPDSLLRFDVFGSVLGLNRLSSGRAYWEVEVRNKPGWDLGVARRDANRKGKLSLNPDNGYWVVVHYEDQKYAALTTPPVSLSVKRKPRKVGVFVDYEEGLVSFYDVTSQSHIYSFTECSFGGEILPYFSPHLKQNEKNSNPLIISAVQKQQ
uniref:B30.2/SPRY domain-containing protein n=1 Tax=Oreochromis niloticus TaxID=8128 RepID=A0A669CSF4_ORENI